MTPTPAEIATARQTLAVSLNLLPEHLKFMGVQELAPGMPKLLLFNVDLPGHRQHRSTLSARVEI